MVYGRYSTTATNSVFMSAAAEKTAAATQTEAITTKQKQVR